MGAFQSGFQLGNQINDSIDRQREFEQEMALRRAADARQQADHDARMSDRQRISDAYDAYESLDRPTTTGGPTTGNFARMDRGQDPEEIAPVVTTPAAPVSALQREQALGRVAAASRDAAGLRTSAAAQRQFQMSDIAANAMKAKRADIEASLPDLNTNASGYPILYTGKDKNGYTFLTTDGAGKPGQKITMTEAQVRQFYLAHQLADAGFGTEAMTTLASVDKDLAVHFDKWNAAQHTLATTNNTATHDFAQDQSARITAQAAQTSAGAHVQSATAIAQHYGALNSELQQNRADTVAARKVASEFEALSPELQAGAAGRALITKYNMLTAGPGKTIPLGAAGRADPNSMKLYQTLTDAEKEQLKMALQDISTIPVDKATGRKPPALVAQAYRNYGLDPAGFNAETPLDKALRVERERRAKAPAGVPGAPPVDPNASVLDADGIPLPRRSLGIQQGYGTLDARGLLRTPDYSANPRAFIPND